MKKTILVVDDEFDIVDVLRELLTGEGYNVVTASNGREGLMRVAEGQPDLILLDLMMPVVDGREMLQKLRMDPNHGSIPIVLMSAGEGRKLATELGCAAFLKKPFDLNALLDTISGLLGPGEL